MSDMSLTPQIEVKSPFERMARDEPIFSGAALVLALLLIPLGLALTLDTRLFQMENIWIKPFKFAFSLTVYLGTLAAYARWLPDTMRTHVAYRIYAWVVVLAVTAEMVWIGGAAAFGTASHFNVSSPFMDTVYGLMGLLAITLTTASAVYGVAIWRNPATGLSDGLRLSLALGLVLTLPLTLITAGYMAAQSGHLVGEAVTYARLPVMGWSMEVGDLRVPHFFATHAMHVIPLVALVLGGGLRTAWLAALGFSLLTIATFAQAVSGFPLIAA